MDDASIVLVDPEHPRTPDLLREAANKVVLHYSWVYKSLNSGYPLVDFDNWGDCKVTPDNINDNFGYVALNLQLQTPRPTPENRSHNLSTLSGFSQGSAGITPPSSQPPYTPTPSHWNRDPVMLQQQTPQLPSTNQLVSYNPQPMQSPGMFSPFPASQPADMGTMVYGQQPAWPSFRPMIQPTIEDFWRAYEIMAWFQRSAMCQPLPPPPTPSQPGPTFHPPTPTQPGPTFYPIQHPLAQHPSSAVGTQLESPTVPGAPVVTTLSRQDSASSHDALHDLGDPPAGPPHDSSPEPTSPLVQSVYIPSPPPSNSAGGPPRLFEYHVGESNKSIMFCVPIIVKKRGRLAEIFRVGFKPSPRVSRPQIFLL